MNSTTQPHKCTGCQRRRQAQAAAKASAKVQAVDKTVQDQVSGMNKEREQQIKEMFANKK